MDVARAASLTARYNALDILFYEAQPRFLDLLNAMEQHSPALLAMGGEAPPAPRWCQDWFPRLDAAAAYAIVYARAPRMLVEVGSGHSTRWFARAAADAGHSTRIIAIDPAPRATVAGLAVELVCSLLQDLDERVFAEISGRETCSASTAVTC